MIWNARVLQDDFLPKEVVHRHAQMNRIASALEPVVEGDKPQNAFLTGSSGAGKTCIARYSLDPGALYARYETAAADPRTRRTCRNYLSKLQRYNLVDAHGEGRSRVYTPVERRHRPTAVQRYPDPTRFCDLPVTTPAWNSRGRNGSPFGSAC